MFPTEIKPDVFWTGVIDWDLRDFHGFSTYQGTTYNAFLVRDQKVALFDTVKINLLEDFIRTLKRLGDPAQIDYIIVNHAEMDHSSGLPQVLELVQPEKLFCTARGKEALLAHFHREDWPFAIVKEGDTLSLGRRTVRIVESAMLHWPESMASYLVEDRVLISNDIFGQHWATSERFDDQVDLSELDRHSAKYYANIFLPVSPAIGKFLAKLKTLNLPLDLIAPDHGLLWRKHVPHILDLYADWSAQKARPKAVIVYDTMWESTTKMARAIAAGLAGADISVKVLDLRINHRSDVMTELLDAKAVLLGCSVLNRGLLPIMADMLTYMRGLKPFNKIGTAFGSYGWADTGVKALVAALEEMKITVVDPGVSVNYVPTEADLERCRELGTRVAEAIRSSL